MTYQRTTKTTRDINQWNIKTKQYKMAEFYVANCIVIVCCFPADTIACARLAHR